MRARTKKQLPDDLKGLTVISLYFDGRKFNGTLVEDEDNVRRHVDEEHTTLVDQPSGRYLGFATPNCGSGPIGRLAEGPVHELPPRKFKPRDCQQPETLLEAIAEKLGGDQKILRRFVVGAKTGSMMARLQKTEIGPLCHATWITF